MTARAKIAHFTDRFLPLNGIVHVGAHEGQEVPWYLLMDHVPIYLFEPHPGACGVLREKYASDYRVSIFEMALGDTDANVDMFIPRHLHDGSDDSQSGSVLRPDHDSSYPWGDRGVEGRMVGVKMVRFDSLDLQLTSVNALVIDVQGFEYQVLEGFGQLLESFNYLVVECSETPIYRGGASAREVIDFLAERGLRQDSPVQSHDDIFFIRD